MIKKLLLLWTCRTSKKKLTKIKCSAFGKVKVKDNKSDKKLNILLKDKYKKEPGNVEEDINK